MNAHLLATRSLLDESARANERLKLARELHDVAGHKLTALKLNLAITQLDGTGGLVQKNDDICLAGTINVSGIPGAGVLFEGAGSDNILTVQQVVTFIESHWTGNLTTNRANWTFNFTKNQWDTLIQVITGMNEGTLIVTSGC